MIFAWGMLLSALSPLSPAPASASAPAKAPDYRVTLEARPRHGDAQTSNLAVERDTLRMDGTRLPDFFWLSRRDALQEWMRTAPGGNRAGDCRLGDYRLLLRKKDAPTIEETGCLESERGKRLLRARRRLSPWLP